MDIQDTTDNPGLGEILAAEIETLEACEAEIRAAEARARACSSRIGELRQRLRKQIRAAPTVPDAPAA